MKIFLLAALASVSALSARGTAAPDSLTVLVVTGGKSVDWEGFSRMFSSFSHVGMDTASKPGAFSVFASENISKYNAVVFYDMYQPITEEQKAAFLQLFDRGIGCVFLHHALVSHQDWKEYEDIVGGRYHHAPYVEEGKKYGPSTYKHDQEFTVRVLTPDHPVTDGVADFRIVDEIYLNYQVFDGITPLLTTDHRENGLYVGWAKTYRNARVAYLQPGHDRHAYGNPGFRALVLNAIRWVSTRSAVPAR